MKKHFISILGGSILAASICIAGNIQPIVMPLSNVYTNAGSRTAYTSPKVNGFVQTVILTATNTVASLATNNVNIMITANGCGIERTILSNNVTGVAGKSVFNPRTVTHDYFGTSILTTNALFPLASETLTIRAYSAVTNCDVKAYVIIEQP